VRGGYPAGRFASDVGPLIHEASFALERTAEKEEKRISPRMRTYFIPDAGQSLVINIVGRRLLKARILTNLEPETEEHIDKEKAPP
jgi:hypothetical protein